MREREPSFCSSFPGRFLFFFSVLHRANTVVLYFAVQRSPEVLCLLGGIDVPVTDIECSNQGVGYPRTFTARHEVEDPTIPLWNDRFVLVLSSLPTAVSLVSVLREYRKYLQLRATTLDWLLQTKL